MFDQGPSDVVGRGADLEPGTLLAAYRAGMFPMPVARRGAPVWWCPARRGVLHPAELVVSRSLTRSARRLQIRTDTAFEAVLTACAGTPRPGGWITKDIARAYLRLHALGWAHSVEAWTPDGELAGGLYGVAVGGLFAGESMFHEAGAWARDASKVALLGLTKLLTADAAPRLIDVQWLTPHLASLGARTMPRKEYLAGLPALVATPLPACWAG
jgi:leucyl/phenylalanyl-tRNA--protein transferase